MDPADDFLPVKRNKKRRNNRQNLAPLSFSEKQERETATLCKDDQWLRQILQLMKDSVDRMDWDEPPRLLCLGLGSPSELRSARLQLALIMELLAEFKIPPTNASLYDPAFTAEDIDGLEALGMRVFGGEVVKELRHTISSPTILFMPHCDIHLYQGLFEVNWSFECMRRMLILGNPIDQYSVITNATDLKTKFPLVKRLGAHPDWQTISTPDAICDEKAFYALAVQYLQPSHGKGESSSLFHDSLHEVHNETER